MAERADLVNWVEQVLRRLGGEGTVVEVSRRIWERREGELRPPVTCSIRGNTSSGGQHTVFAARAA